MVGRLQPSAAQVSIPARALPGFPSRLLFLTPPRGGSLVRIGGCRPSLHFPTVKLRDLAADWEGLETSRNRFAPVVMAHLKTQDTPRRPDERYTWKLSIVRSLYERGFTRKDVLELFRVIDWLMTLPAELDRAFHLSLQQCEGEKGMPYVTSIERHALEQGREEGLRQAILGALLIRFKGVPEGLRDVIGAIHDLEILARLHDAAILAATLESFQESLPQP